MIWLVELMACAEMGRLKATRRDSACCKSVYRKGFGEFVLPARIPPDRPSVDPTPFDKGVFGTVDRTLNFRLWKWGKMGELPRSAPKAIAAMAVIY